MDRTANGTSVKMRAEVARMGGLACLQKHGREFYREIGKKGYQATLARHWQGDALAYRRWLIAKGWNVVVDALADIELSRRLAAGEPTACVELTYLDDEPPDSYYDRRAEESAWMDRYENGFTF